MPYEYGCQKLTFEISFLAKEEDIVGEYRFGVYDLLVLPPSFPYGGMVGLLLRMIYNAVQSSNLYNASGKRLSFVFDTQHVFFIV